MANKKDTPTVTAKVSVLYVKPTSVAATECPHCKELNFVEVEQANIKQSLLHPCSSCDAEYFIYIPDFSPIK